MTEWRLRPSRLGSWRGDRDTDAGYGSLLAAVRVSREHAARDHGELRVLHIVRVRHRVDLDQLAPRLPFGAVLSGDLRHRQGSGRSHNTAHPEQDSASESWWLRVGPFSHNRNLRPLHRAQPSDDNHSAVRTTCYGVILW